MKRAHLIGIMGSGMQGLVPILEQEGWTVSGSDSQGIQVIEEAFPSIKAYDESDTEALMGVQQVIASAAIPHSHPQYESALRGDLPISSYTQFLGSLSESRSTYAVAGTHGKTTTTAMLSQALLASRRDPMAILGSGVPAWNYAHVHVGTDPAFVVEACEFQKGFLDLSVDLLIITNIDYDHADTYPTPESYEQAYRDLLSQMSPESHCVAFPSESFLRVKEDYQGTWYDARESLSTVPSLPIPGEHLRQDAALVMTACQLLGCDMQAVSQSLSSYQGTQRRFEFYGERSGIRYYDDYAHHPTEIRATLESLRLLDPEAHLTIVFQPHQIRRTLDFLGEFAEALSQADSVRIIDVYAVRGEDQEQSDPVSRQLAQEIQSRGHADTLALGALDSISPESLDSGLPGGILMTMGAGPVHTLLQELFSD